MKRTKFDYLKNNRVKHWIRQIDSILSKDARFVLNTWPTGKVVLERIRQTIKETNKVTEFQIQAIKNIKYGKNEDWIPPLKKTK